MVGRSSSGAVGSAVAPVVVPPVAVVPAVAPAVAEGVARAAFETGLARRGRRHESVGGLDDGLPRARGPRRRGVRRRATS